MKSEDEIGKTPVNEVETTDETVDSLESNFFEDEKEKESKIERESNSVVKGAGWLLGIVAVFALVIITVWLIGLGDKSYSNGSDRIISAIEKSYSVNPPKTISTDTIVPAAKPTTIVAQGITKSTSAVDMSRIDREAREVIHGDFGNNPLRKQKLGADYALVQARVNELLK